VLLAGPARARLLFAFTVAAAILYAPWPIRNLHRFGAPHFEGTQWMRRDGRPLSTGPIAWMRTWSTGRPEEARLASYLVFSRRLKCEHAIVPRMYDDERERQMVERVCDRLAEEGLTPDVDADFRLLARERLSKHPLRTLVALPLERIWRTLGPPSPQTIGWTRMPLLSSNRWILSLWHWALWLLALAGAVVLYRSGTRPLPAACLTAIFVRLAIHAFAVPHEAGTRFFLEAIPMGDGAGGGRYAFSTCAKSSSTGVARPKIETSTRTFCFSAFTSSTMPAKFENGPSMTRTFSPSSNEMRGLGALAPSVICALICAMSFSGTGVGLVPPRKPVIFGVFLTRWKVSSPISICTNM
jgi:hypothetical protein